MATKVVNLCVVKRFKIIEISIELEGYAHCELALANLPVILCSCIEYRAKTTWILEIRTLLLCVYFPVCVA